MAMFMLGCQVDESSIRDVNLHSLMHLAKHGPKAAAVDPMQIIVVERDDSYPG